MGLFRILFVAWLSAILAACGGGGDTEASPASQLAQASPVVLEAASCATPGTAGQLMVDGQCLKSFPEMAQIGAAGGTSSKEPSSAQLPQAASVDAAALFGWAPTACSPRQSETLNFCLTSGATGNFAGIAVQVLLVASTTGSCITALADMAGRQIDIYTNTAGVQVVSPLSTYWNTNGCR